MPNLTDPLRSLAAALGPERISPEKIFEYEEALADLTADQCAKIFHWFKINGDRFPTIKAIRGQAVAFGWAQKPPRQDVDDWVVVECVCKGTFAVSEKELRGDPTRIYPCSNRKIWGCLRTFEAGFILAHMDDKRFLSLHVDWKIVFPQLHQSIPHEGEF